MTAQHGASRPAPARAASLFAVLAIAGASLTLSAGRAAGLTGDPVLLNEFLVSHTGADTAEYFELYGTPGHSLAGLSLVVVEGDSSGGPGTIDLRVDLPAGAVLGGNGLYLVGNPAGLQSAYGVTPDLALPCSPDPAPCAELVENGSQTIGLVATASVGAVGTLISGTEDVRDAVGLTDMGASDAWFWNAPVLGPDDGFLPAGGRRVADGVDTDTADDWSLADFGLGAANTPTAATPYTPPDPDPDPDPGPGDEPPAMSVGVLQSMVDGCQADGSLSAARSGLLTSRLDRISQLLDDGRTATASAQLRAFGNQARGLAPRWITASCADRLDGGAAVLRQSLGG